MGNGEWGIANSDFESGIRSLESGGRKSKDRACDQSFVSPLPSRERGQTSGSMKKQDFAKHLRKRMTEAESILWYHLRAHRLDGQKFRRQQVIGDYVVDFVHFGTRLIVEADGGQHLESARDHQRDAWLSSQGFVVLRFWNDDILLRTDGVLEAIWQALRDAPSPPTPLPRGERGGRQ